jgi:hypothetical protein
VSEADIQPDIGGGAGPPVLERPPGLADWMRATSARRPGTSTEEPMDRGLFNQAREWLAEVRAEPSNGLLSDRGVAELVVTHALMRIRSLEDQCAWLRANMAGDDWIRDMWRGE